MLTHDFDGHGATVIGLAILIIPRSCVGIASSLHRASETPPVATARRLDRVLAGDFDLF